MRTCSDLEEEEEEEEDWIEPVYFVEKLTQAYYDEYFNVFKVSHKALMVHFYRFAYKLRSLTQKNILLFR